MKDAYNIFKTSVSLLIAVCILTYASVVSYWLLYPYNVIDVHSITVMNQNKIVKQGGTLIYEIDYTKWLDAPGVVSRRLINTYTISYSDMTAHVPTGSRITQTHLPIPAYASPGRYHLLWTVRYQVNPMRYLTETIYSDEFFVFTDKSINQGERGEQGETGETGATGPRGSRGTDFGDVVYIESSPR